MLRGRAEAQESGCRVSEGILVVIHHDELLGKTPDPFITRLSLLMGNVFCIASPSEPS
jgi:hypothetical protein